MGSDNLRASRYGQSRRSRRWRITGALLMTAFATVAFDQGVMGARPAGAATTADTSITMTVDTVDVIAGLPLTYNIHVHNYGPDTASGAVVTDVLPSGLTYMADTALTNPAGGCSVATQTVTCTLADIPTGGNVDFKLRVMVSAIFLVSDADGSAPVTNTASITSSNDPDTSDNSSTATTLVGEQSDLIVTKYVQSNGVIGAGQTFWYTIIVDNLGPSAARKVSIYDSLLNNNDVSIQSCAFSVSQGGGAITQFTCTTGPVVQTQFSTNAGTFATNFLVPFAADPDPSVSTPTGRLRASFRMTASDAADVTNIARVTSPTPDPVMSNNLSSVPLTVVPAADLSITKTASPEPVVAGELLTYTMTVTNNGPSKATNVVAKDDLPSQVSVVSVTTGGGTCDTGVPGDALRPLTCNLGTMAFKSGSDGNACGPHQNPDTACPPETITVVVRVNRDVPGGTLVFNRARVSSDVLDPDNSNNNASALSTVDASADLTIVKTGLGPNPWVAGEDRTIRYDVSDLGPSNASDVVVSDALPDGLEFQAAYLGGDAGQGGIPLPCTVTSENDLECKLGGLAPSDGVKSLYVHVHVRADVPDGTVLASDGVVSSDTPDPVPGNNSDPESKTITIRADLAAAVTTDSDFFPAPQLVVVGPGHLAEELLQEFTITATNNGPSDAHKVLAAVTLPPADIGHYVSDDGGCTLTDLTLACPIGDLAAGASKSFHVMFHIADGSLFVTLSAEVGIDEDQDLVLDRLDLCDGTPAGTAVDASGCPAPDADGDRIVDASDACPLTPAGTAVDATGCPAPDADGDGVRDAIDACPGTAPGTPVNLVGCPDADQDGVADTADACPGTPANTSVTLIGCPLDPNLANNTASKTIVSATGDLPATGADTGVMTPVGAAMVLVGLGLFGAGRRRRARPVV